MHSFFSQKQHYNHSLRHMYRNDVFSDSDTVLNRETSGRQVGSFP